MLGSKHLLLVVDPDVPFEAVGTTSLPLVHTILYNCDVSTYDGQLEVSLYNYKGGGIFFFSNVLIKR